MTGTHAFMLTNLDGSPFSLMDNEAIGSLLELLASPCQSLLSSKWLINATPHREEEDATSVCVFQQRKDVTLHL